MLSLNSGIKSGETFSSEMKEIIRSVYQDKNLLVVSKPAGLPVYRTQGSSLMQTVIQQDSSLTQVGHPPRYGLIHRLDKETSGLILIAKNDQALSFFQEQFQARKVKKKYLALVEGHFSVKNGTIKSLIGRSKKDFRKQKVFLPLSPNASQQREAVTLYQVIKEFPHCTLLELSPQTGRKHQLRVHLAWKHHPIIGDDKYGFKGQFKVKYLEHLFLHAFYLKIGHFSFF